MTGDNRTAEDALPLTTGSKNVNIAPSMETGGNGKENQEGPIQMDSGLNFRLAFAIAAGAFGSAWQHGYNTGVMNAPQKLIENWINSSSCTPETTPDDDTDGVVACSGTKTEGELKIIIAILVSAFCVGGIIGGSLIGVISSRFGRKGGLLLINILMAIGGIFLFAAKYANSWEVLAVGRLIIGVNAGLNAGISPMYLSEISPVALRGAVGTVYQLIITISILISQVLGINNVLGNEAGWPFLLGLTIIPGILQLITLPFCPESPKYLLLEKNKPEEATKALEWLRGTPDVKDEMDDMRVEHEAIKSLPHVSFKDMIVNPALRSPLIIAMMMMLAQQLSGINCAIFYSTSIFRDAGLNDSQAQSATLGMGAMNVAMTVISLILIEKAGRKTLMLSGLSVMIICTTVLLICLKLASTVAALKYLSIVMVISFVVGFATGPGSIPWFFVTELFQQSARGMATAIAVGVNWTANFLVGLGFEPLKYAMGEYVFLIFIGLQAVFILYVWFKVPETKNKTIEEITAQFRQNL